MNGAAADRLGWGLLATGFIAPEFVRGVRGSDTGRLVAVASRDAARSEAFATEHDIPTAHAGYQALIEDPLVDAVYIATPHSLHAEWAIKAAEAGKHVLCEKPLALNAAEASAMVDAARRNHVVLVEGFMYRAHPQTAALEAVVRDAAVGEVRLIDVAMSFWTDAASAPRLIDPQLGGGAILDVGCYCTSMALLVASSALGRSAEPTEVLGEGYVDPDDRVDHFALATLRFEADLYAQLSCGVRLADENRVRVHGSDGLIELTPPSWVSFDADDTSLEITRHGHGSESIHVPVTKLPFAYEIDAFAAHVNGHPAPNMSWDESLANMRTLDRWRDVVGADRDDGRDVDSSG
jgi:predicted dehydrogenase